MANDCLPPVFHKAADRNGPASDRPPDTLSGACSTLLYSSDGQLLGARIAPDGQWRFPPADSLPGKFVTCLLTYEDKRFFRHPGVDPVASSEPCGSTSAGARSSAGEHDHHAAGTDRAGQPRPYPV